MLISLCASSRESGCKDSNPLPIGFLLIPHLHLSISRATLSRYSTVPHIIADKHRPFPNLMAYEAAQGCRSQGASSGFRRTFSAALTFSQRNVKRTFA
jgi:hypothetical protein